MDHLDTYLDELKTKRLSVATRERHAFVIERINDFKPIESIDKTDLITFFNQLKNKESTKSINSQKAIIKNFFAYIGKPEVSDGIDEDVIPIPIKSYLDELKAKKLSKYTIKNYALVLKALNDFKPLKSIDKTDLINFFNQFNGSENSTVLYQVTIIKYFTDIGKSDVVSWIELKKPKETLKSDDILTPDDINKMIEATDSHYWKALIAFLFETGCRISEANTLQYKDFQDTDQGMIVNIPTNKTAAGYRKVIIPFSSQYIRNLKTYTNAKKDGQVFGLCYSHTHITLNQIAKDAGIDKPISPHKFRHAQATDMVKRAYNEAIIRKKLGWTPTSSMIARYQHLNDEDVINATLENNGKLPLTAAPRTDIKEAEKVTLIDASMQLAKINEENNALRDTIFNLQTALEKQDNDVAQFKDDMEKRVEDRMKQFEKILAKIPTDVLEKIKE